MFRLAVFCGCHFLCFFFTSNVMYKLSGSIKSISAVGSWAELWKFARSLICPRNFTGNQSVQNFDTFLWLCPHCFELQQFSGNLERTSVAPIISLCHSQIWKVAIWTNIQVAGFN